MGVVSHLFFSFKMVSRGVVFFVGGLSPFFFFRWSLAGWFSIWVVSHGEVFYAGGLSRDGF